jgi:PAS domain S-box-containing protein
MDQPTSDFPSIVLVNDDPLQLGFLTEMLSGRRWRVLPFSSARDALTSMRASTPSLIITDLYMPEMDGWAFCRLLRSATHPELNQIPVLVVSALLGTEEAKDIATELGATDFFPLPIDRARLCAKVASMLDAPHRFDTWHVLLIHRPSPDVDAIFESFSRHGCTTVHASTTEEANRQLASRDWDAVLCDLDIYSRESIAAWRVHNPLPTLIALSSSQEPSDAVASLRAGANAHLRRPYAADYLFGLCQLAQQKNALIRAQRLLELRTIELRNSDRLLQSILDTSEQVFVVIDQQGRIVLENRAARRTFTEVFSHPLVTGAKLATVLPKDFQHRVAERIAAAMEGRSTQRDITVTDKQGRRRHFLIRYTPLDSLEGGQRRVCFNAQDMTRRSEAEEALLLRNHALGSVSQGVIIKDHAHRITYANDTFVQITGFERNEFIGHKCDFIYGPLTDPKALADINQHLEKGIPYNGELYNYRKNGEGFWNEFSISQVKDPSGHTTQFVCVIRDVTARKLQEKELHASQARLQALFDHSHDAILLADDHGRFIKTNPAACTLLGHPREALLALSVNDIFVPGDHTWSAQSWTEILLSGQRRAECHLRRRDGSTVRIEYDATARILPDLNLVIIRDNSERHALQAQVLRQQRLESVGRLASGVAHDLNNILTPILLAPSMLRGHIRDAGARMLLETIEAGARRGSAIVKQLLSFSRSDFGEKTHIDFRNILQDSVAIIRETFPKDILMEVSAGLHPQTVLADPHQLQQVIIGLALNAADAMPRGGRLCLSLDPVEVSPAEAAANPDATPGQFVGLQIVDHGTGISPAIIDKIFDPFFTTKPFGQGSGLGLSVAIGIVRSHGGFMQVSSRVGVGTIVKVRLPLLTSPAARSPESTAPVVQPFTLLGSGRTVLVVDDENAVRETVRLALSQEGYRVLCAADVDAAQSQLQACGGRVDIILTDLSMPGTSGTKFIEHLHNRRPDQLVMVMTGNDSSEALPSATRGYICGVLPKPFDAAQLTRSIHQALATRQDPPVGRVLVGQ